MMLKVKDWLIKNSQDKFRKELNRVLYEISKKESDKKNTEIKELRNQARIR